VNARFIAWLVGVEPAAVKAYRDVSDWPSHWAAKAQHKMRSLGLSSQRDAMSAFLRSHS
jgi:hypothetical protein